MQWFLLFVVVLLVLVLLCFCGGIVTRYGMVLLRTVIFRGRSLRKSATKRIDLNEIECIMSELDKNLDVQEMMVA